MNRRGLARKAFALLLALTAGPSLLWGAALPDRVDFNYHIKPLLSDRCFICHGPDEKARKAKLRLDVKEGAFKAIDHGMFVLKPGDLARSEVIRRITSPDPDEKMPPPKSNLALSQDEVELIKRWVQQGAEWKRHWSFIALGDVKVPTVKNKKWPRNEIDRFVLAKLEGENLQPAPAASKERLLRRVTFDLTGLPPTLEEVDAFLADQAPDAYEKVVDRLLASPAYGERMAADWLDVARYADTYGYQADRFNHLWPWRDWVISAFNRNVHFNDFILWQIAGDLLPGATREQKLATAFNRNHRQTNEGGSVDEEFRVEYNADRVQTTSTAFLGLTMECARCHDHKYDPISQEDYYRLFAFFNSTDEAGLYSHFTDAIPSPTLLLFKDDAQEAKHREMKQAIAAKEQELAARRAAAAAGFEVWRHGAWSNGLTGLVAHYPFDSVAGQRTPNALGTNFPAQLRDAPSPEPGKFGGALRFNGENSVTIDQVADFKRTNPFSFSFWMTTSEELPEIVVLHHQQAGSDAGYNGYQFVLEDGCATFALVHFWPGNALKLRTREKLKLNEWLHVGITYDGSSRAAGVKLYLNGVPAETETVRDSLFKDFANNQPLTLGARFRGRGFKGGRIDDLKIFNRCLTALEVAELFDGASIENAWTVVRADQRTPVPPPLSSEGKGGGAPSRKRLGAADSAASSSPSLLEPERGGTLGKARDGLFAFYLATVDPESLRLSAELKDLRDQENDFINRIDEIMVMGDLPTPRPTYVLKRGQYDAHGDVVEPATPASILPLDPTWPRNRLGLARWLIAPQNPLTSRVMVNRYWQIFFGQGIVLTAENFGSQGTQPTHPELLDWLAKHFMDSDWDLKALCKRIVTSATYRQSSRADARLLARDPDNKLLARGPKNRLTAEMLRDQALAAAGLLVRKIGGPSVKPYQPEGLWEEKSSGWKYQPDRGEGLYRRSLYTYWKRASQHPMMLTFDAAERNTCLARRQNTSTPLQALVLLNDIQFVEATRKIGERALRESGPALEPRITFIFRLLTGRRPSAKELSVLRRLYEEQFAFYRADEDAAAALAQVGESKSDSALSQAELAASTALASAILNFDEAIQKR